MYLGCLPHMFYLTLWPTLANSSMHNPWSLAKYMCSIWFKSCEYFRTHTCAFSYAGEGEAMFGYFMPTDAGAGQE